MSTNKTIEFDFSKRINQVLEESWRIFKSQFIHDRHKINKEAPFQHHFAQIIRTVGNLYSIGPSDLFKVDLETKHENLRGQVKYIDITCEFYNQINCAIELKFKTAKQGAQDHGRIDAYLDIEALEHLVADGYNLGKFYMITDSTVYLRNSRRGVGTIFSMHEGFISSNDLLIADTKGRAGVQVKLKGSYKFDWEQIGDWYFLELTVN